MLPSPWKCLALQFQFKPNSWQNFCCETIATYVLDQRSPNYGPRRHSTQPQRQLVTNECINIFTKHLLIWQNVNIPKQAHYVKCTALELLCCVVGEVWDPWNGFFQTGVEPRSSSESCWNFVNLKVCGPTLFIPSFIKINKCFILFFSVWKLLNFVPWVPPVAVDCIALNDFTQAQARDGNSGH